MKVRDTFIKLIVAIARILFGITFIFSGFVKAIDPLGFTYKIEDYLISFHLAQFVPLALTFALALILLEFLLGVFILFGIYRKWTTHFAVLFMVVMTPLTLYIALANPVEDCGCFGDALIISNWSTFYKNIVLLTFAIVLLVYRRQITPFYTKKTKHYVFAFVLLFFLAFSFYNIVYLPVLDFRPYKTGTNIQENMAERGEGDVYDNIYVYEKDGVVKEFTEENYPWEDSTWTFVELKSELIKEGDKPTIEDFSIILYQNDSNGDFVKTNDITLDVLSQPYSFLVVSTSLNKISDKSMLKLHSLANYGEKNAINMYIVTSSDENAVKKWDDKLGGPNVNYASMDELTLKTIIRSNPGIVMLKEGTIQAKWSKNSIPDETKLNKTITQFEVNEKDASHNNSTSKLFIICLLFASTLLGVKWYDRKLVNTYKIK